MSATIDTWAGRLGLICGFLAVATWLAVAGRPAAGPGVPAATLRVSTLGSGELEAKPLTRPILPSAQLRAGDRPRTGTLTVRNITARGLAFALRAKAVQKELDGSAWIEVADGDERLVRTNLGRARKWSGTRLELASGERRTLRVRVWIPQDAPDGWQATRGDVTLELTSSAGAGR